MSNLILTPTTYARGILMNLGGGALITRNMSLDYREEFGDKKVKKGETIKVRKPQRFEGTTNVKYTPEPLKNIQTSVTVDKTFGVHFDWPMVEKTLKIDRANEKYFRPAALRIASKINADAAEFAFFNTFNIVGTPGVVPGTGTSDTTFTTMQVYQNAGDLLYEQGMPKGERLTCIVTRRMSSALSARFAGLFAPVASLNKRWKTGEMDPTGLGYEWDWDQGLYTHTTGTFAGTPQVDGADQTDADGDNSQQELNLKGLTNGTTGKKGDWLTIAGVYAVHPQTRVSTGQLKQFRVMSDWVAGADTKVTITIAPAITPSGQYQNVSASADDGAAVLFCNGTAADPDAYAETSCRAALLLHRNAHAFVSVPYEVPEGNMGAKVALETDDETGISLMVARAYDWEEHQEINRIDTLYGFGWLYREMASIILSAA